MARIQTKLRPLMVLLICIGLAGCAGHQSLNEIDPEPEQSSLDFWLEGSLIPYLLQQLDQHPRFKGQPVLLVQMQGENVLPRIDGLTEQIRDKINDALLKKSGIHLAWRPLIQPWPHPQSLEEIACDDYSTIRYTIGIDTGLSPGQRKLYVKIRALNLDENKWISGFGKSWAGTPTRDQLDALARQHPDEHLRGRRPLPFSEQQPDMLAAYLARNLSCLLRRGERDDLVVHVVRPDPNMPEMIKTSLDLVGKYLTRFREVEVTDDPDQANVSVVSAFHTIDQDLHQVWISARQRQAGIYLPGAETEAYVILKPQKETQVAAQKPAVPFPRYQNLAGQAGIIGSFDLLTPLNQRFCATKNPWRSGIRRLYPHDSILAGSCVAVELEVTVPAYLFLVGQDAAGELTRLLPSDCPALSPGAARLKPGQLLQFPDLSDPQAGVLELGGSPGTESIYAVAATTGELAAGFADRIAEFASPCRPDKKVQGLPRPHSFLHPRERIQDWQNYLKQLVIRYPGQLEWREFSFRHVAVR